MLTRCAWPGKDELMQHYHDHEWGVPLHNDQRWFEFLVLDGMQAGLSWQIILRKRENFRRAFDNFDPEVVARYDEAKIATLLTDKGIVRNRLKIRATVSNAQAFLTLQDELGSFDTYIWAFVGGETIQNRWASLADVPATSPESAALSKDLKKRGFKFVGSTICYAFMQSGGLVNDHTIDCFRHAALT